MILPPALYVNVFIKFIIITEVAKRPLTNCEQEKEENLRKLAQIPDLHVPECSLFDGLYLDVQRTWVGSKFCVKRLSGDHVKGTDTEIGKADPVCPGKLKCLGSE